MPGQCLSNGTPPPAGLPENREKFLSKPRLC
jgi:hypothetical protein